jgi:hypothetical protein
MKSLEEIKEILSREKPLLTENYGVKEIGIFGSFVRGDVRKKSDLDVLVAFENSISLLEFIGLEEYLSTRLGVKVDLVMKSALKPNIGENILKEVVIL